MMNVLSGFPLTERSDQAIERYLTDSLTDRRRSNARLVVEEGHLGYRPTSRVERMQALLGFGPAYLGNVLRVCQAQQSALHPERVAQLVESPLARLLDLRRFFRKELRITMDAIVERVEAAKNPSIAAVRQALIAKLIEKAKLQDDEISLWQFSGLLPKVRIFPHHLLLSLPRLKESVNGEPLEPEEARLRTIHAAIVQAFERLFAESFDEKSSDAPAKQVLISARELKDTLPRLDFATPNLQEALAAVQHLLTINPLEELQRQLFRIGSSGIDIQSLEETFLPQFELPLEGMYVLIRLPRIYSDDPLKEAKNRLLDSLQEFLGIPKCRSENGSTLWVFSSEEVITLFRNKITIAPPSAHYPLSDAVEWLAEHLRNKPLDLLSTMFYEAAIKGLPQADRPPRRGRPICFLTPKGVILRSPFFVTQQTYLGRLDRWLGEPKRIWFYDGETNYNREWILERTEAVKLLRDYLGHSLTPACESLLQEMSKHPLWQDSFGISVLVENRKNQLKTAPQLSIAFTLGLLDPVIRGQLFDLQAKNFTITTKAETESWLRRIALPWVVFDEERNDNRRLYPFSACHMIARIPGDPSTGQPQLRFINILHATFNLQPKEERLQAHGYSYTHAFYIPYKEIPAFIATLQIERRGFHDLGNITLEGENAREAYRRNIMESGRFYIHYKPVFYPENPIVSIQKKYMLTLPRP